MAQDTYILGNSLQQNTGSNNLSVGISSANQQTTGNNNTYLGNFICQASTVGGNNNTLIGAEIASALQNASDNTVLGYQAGSGLVNGNNSVIIGSQHNSAVDINTSIVLGNNFGSGLGPSTVSDTICLGDQTNPASNTFYLGNTGQELLVGDLGAGAKTLRPGVDGQTTLGDATNRFSNVETQGMNLHGDLIPVGVGRSIGSATNRFSDLQTQQINLAGDLISVGATNSIGTSGTPFNSVFTQNTRVDAELFLIGGSNITASGGTVGLNNITLVPSGASIGQPGNALTSLVSNNLDVENNLTVNNTMQLDNVTITSTGSTPVLNTSLEMGAGVSIGSVANPVSNIVTDDITTNRVGSPSNNSIIYADYVEHDARTTDPSVFNPGNATLVYNIGGLLKYRQVISGVGQVPRTLLGVEEFTFQIRVEDGGTVISNTATIRATVTERGEVHLFIDRNASGSFALTSGTAPSSTYPINDAGGGTTPLPGVLRPNESIACAIGFEGPPILGEVELRTNGEMNLVTFQGVASGTAINFDCWYSI